MSAQSARELVRRLESSGAPVWVDGGWAADALIGRQTRDHGDLDIAIEERHVAVARRVLEALGFRDAERDDNRDWNFVMEHPDGREVDFHVVRLDDHGDGIYGPPENNELYPSETLAGNGVLDGHSVRCLSPNGLIAFRVEYPHPPRERDFHDVRVVCAHFGIPVPEKYQTSPL
jgi:lincosamide nucleotidyltransferase A/C/D/E